MSDSNAFICTICKNTYPLDTCDWRCQCGGLFDLEGWTRFDAAQIDAGQIGLWRYRALLPVDPAWEPVTLGEGNTPLIPVDWEGQPLYLKIESQSPTGSFKDRGSAVLMTALLGLGIERVVEDSSGNAGTSLAAYAARAGIECTICVPNAVAGPKLVQMAAHGAEVVEIKGRREYAALAAWAAAAHGAYYASHVYNPYFLAGAETLAYELWEQLGQVGPEAVILPVGNGTLLLGVYHGFLRLLGAGLISRLPRLIAVQAAACAPIHRAFVDGFQTVEAVTAVPTVAGGVAIGQPVRGAQILLAVRATGGAVVSVDEEEIRQAHNQLAARGFYVENTAAVAMAALPHLRDELAPQASVVVPLTGHGLKAAAGQ